jgi:hypothetical protein
VNEIEIIDDIDDIPVDEDIPPDLSDVKTAAAEVSDRMSVIDTFALADKPRPQVRLVIPYKRLVRPGDRGNDIKAIKRALWRAGYLPFQAFTTLYGPVALRAMKKFQKDHGIKPTGRYGRPTHRALASYYDKFAFLLYVGHSPDKDPEVKIRAAIIANALYLYNHRNLVHYRQSRPIDGHKDKHKLPLYTDCSGAATDVYEWGGGPDPNGLNFNGAGYTGTIARHGKYVPLSEAGQADTVLYGQKWPYEHVVLLLQKGSRKVWSHGSEGGPYILDIDYRSDRVEIRDHF